MILFLYRYVIKYDVLDSKRRIDIMTSILNRFDRERKTHPERWGAEDGDGKADDSFVFASFFVDSDRDKNMVQYLREHLNHVYLATLLACVLFLHPFFGLLTAGFLVLTMLQVQGILSWWKVREIPAPSTN